MTDLLDAAAGSTTPSDQGEAVRPVPLLLGSVTTTLWAAAVGIAPVLAVVLLAWVAEPNPAARAIDVIRFALGGWLLAHGAPATVAGGPIGLVPLALTALVVWQVMRAATKTARAVGADNGALGLRVVAAVTGCYALIGGAVGVFVDGSIARAGIAIGATGVVGLVSSVGGVLRVPAVRQELLRRLPADLVPTLREGALAAAAVLGGAALITIVTLIIAGHRMLDLGRSFGSGPVGTGVLALLCLLYLPTVVVWAAAYVVGPGFAIGTGTTVSAFTVHVGPLPAFPLLAAVPGTAGSALARCLLGVPLVVGVVSGIRASRAARDDAASWVALLGVAAARGPVAGLVMGALALAAGGPLGSGRLAAVGPSAWRVAAVLALEIGVASALGAAAERGVTAARTWWSARRGS